MAKKVNLNFKIVNAIGQPTDIDAGKDVADQMVRGIKLFIDYDMSKEVSAMTSAQIQFLQNNIAILTEEDYQIVLSWIKNEYSMSPSGYYGSSLEQLVSAFIS